MTGRPGDSKAPARATDADTAPVVAAREPRQRWRITYARDAVGSDAVGRATLDAWQAALEASGLPVAGLEPEGSGRARIAFAAPLPAAARGAAELADLFLLDPCRAWEVREALQPRLPAGHHWRSAESVWLGAPPLAGRVVGADWTVLVAAPDDAAPVRLKDAAGALTAARTLPRSRPKGGAARSYDLRPLLSRLSIDAPGGRGPGSVSIRFRTRIHPELGSGRPEEVIAALSEAAGLEIDVDAMTRDRIVLADDPDAAPGR